MAPKPDINGPSKMHLLKKSNPDPIAHGKISFIIIKVSCGPMLSDPINSFEFRWFHVTLAGFFI